MYWNKLQNRKFDRHKPPYGWFPVREMEQQLKPIQSFQIYINMLLPHLHKPEDRNIYSVDSSGHGGTSKPRHSGKERILMITWAAWGGSDRTPVWRPVSFRCKPVTPEILGGGLWLVLGLKLKCYTGPLHASQEDTNQFLEKRIRALVNMSWRLMWFCSDWMDVCLLWKATSLNVRPPPEAYWKHFSAWTLRSALEHIVINVRIHRQRCPNECDVAAHYLKINQ